MGARGSSAEGQSCFSWAFSLTTETVFQSESSQSGPILPEETEAKVSPFTGGGRAVGRASSNSRLCLHQGIVEDDGRGVEPPGPGNTVSQGDLEETVVAALGPDTQDLEDQSPPQSLPSSPKAGESPCLCVSLSF